MFDYLDTSFVIASIMYTKNKHYSEDFVTLKEVNVIRNILQQRFNKEKLNIIITDEFDFSYFKYIDGVILKNDTLASIVNRYQGYCYSIECLKILWDDNFIFEILENMRNGFESKSLEIIINKVLDNPSLFYKKVAYELSKEEYEFIKSKIEKSCSNCLNNCSESTLCGNWQNDELVGKKKVLTKFSTF